jgi:hypothetical protein
LSERPDLRSLLGDDVDPVELERLERVHELLLEADPPPELSPALQSAPAVGGERKGKGGFSWFGRPRLAAAIALAAAVAAAFFGIGYLVGHKSTSFDSKHTVVMHGTKRAPNALASIEVGQADTSGNIPMLLHANGLPKLKGRAYYELFLTVHGKPVASCGTFQGGERVNVRLSIPYPPNKTYDGWVATRERWKTPHPGPVVLTTFV